MTTRDPAHVPPIGSLIGGKYRVDRLLGRGGMGVVVAATHTTLGEAVAIKLMFKDDLAEHGAIERFEREARAAVMLKDNEHVACVRDVDRLPDGLPYMVMDLLHGQDLDKLLKERGVFPIDEACSYVVQACNALVSAHALGIIHRDLKPQNLFLTHRKDGSACIKLLDFGIAKHVLLHDSPLESLTKPTDVLGSAIYMSPEQLRSSRDVVPQSDIWSLGVVLYKLLTGKVPFSGLSHAEVWMALLDDKKPAPPPSQFRADIPPELESVILKCLEKDLRRRYSSARELMAALAPFTIPGQTSATDEGENATTLPLVRHARPIGFGGTLPMLPQLKDLQRNEQATPSVTQPLDPRMLQAALHGYLPPRAIMRPAPPSTPQLRDMHSSLTNESAQPGASSNTTAAIGRMTFDDPEATTAAMRKSPPVRVDVRSPRMDEVRRVPSWVLVAAGVIAAILVLLAVQLR